MKIASVPAGHPRVYARPGDLDAIRAKLDMAEFANDWQIVQEAAEREDPERAGPFCSAFIHLIRQDPEGARRAIEQTLDLLPSVEDARTFNMPMHWAACVYDWCYELLTDAEKQRFIDELIRIASSHAPGYPASMRCPAVVGHETEGWILTAQLPAGVAIYDESKVMYDAAAKVFFERFVPVREYHYPSHTHHQGDSYGTRLLYDLAGSWLFRRMGAGDVLTRHQRFVPYHSIYNLRPDGQQIRRGDSYTPGRSGRKMAIMMMAGSYYEDPYLLTMADGDFFDDGLQPLHQVFELLLRPAGVQKRPLSDLPRTKVFPMPMGEMVTRTGWNQGIESRDAVVFMRAGGTFFGNHQIRDMGTFQIYYRGALALVTGLYQSDDTHYGTDHWKCYYHQTLATNGLLIYDPDEPLRRIRPVNDGGQCLPNEGRDHPKDMEEILSDGYEIGKVAGCGFGPDPQSPEYSHITGDITGAYTDKVEAVSRSMVTLNLGNDRYPCALVVHDRVISADPSYKKTWLLHSIQEPQIEGSTTTVVRDEEGYEGEGRYFGKLEAMTLLPEAVDIRKVGGPGKEFWVESTGENYQATPRNAAYEPGAWRVEVSPRKERKEDRFLHVLTVMDADVEAGPEIHRFGDEGAAGIALLDRAVVFCGDDGPQDELSFELEADGQVKILVLGLAPGHWDILPEGEAVQRRIPVTESAGSLYFEGGGGAYALSRIDAPPPPEPEEEYWRPE